MKVTVTFPDKTKKSYDKGITLKEITADFEKGSLVAKVDGELVDLGTKLEKDADVEFISFSSAEGKYVFWHSAAHVMAQAVMELFPEAKLTIGPPVEEGFYYDIDYEVFRPTDIPAIEDKMHEIVKKNLPFERRVISKKECEKLFCKNPYKMEMSKEHDELLIYESGDFCDLCRGPHVPSTGYIKAFKLTKIAGAYWRADAGNKQLQRIYGIAFPTREELKQYVTLKEEAEKRDHKKLGKQMELFSFHEEAPGFPFILPKGMVLWELLMDFWRKEHKKAGYVQIKTPIILSRKLWEQSGHWDHYKENMYFTKIDNQDYAVKPMNCPGSLLVYKEKIHSYKEFPLRMAEVGLVHRHELSGVLNGMFRVRAFHQDDAHIFMTEEQIKDEIINVTNLVDRFYKAFGLTYHVELSTMPEKHIGEANVWKKAEKALADAMKEIGMDIKVNPGDGAFYGPKLDFHIRDALGRTWQCATIQLDFAMPEKFDLTYEGKDGTRHRPVMIHRVVYGAIERFIGVIIEHTAGKLPLWLNPVQVKILPITENNNEYAAKVMRQIEEGGIRVELDDKSNTLGKKVREAQLEKVNYILVIGDKEQQEGTVNVRTRDNEVQGAMKINEFISKLQKEIEEMK